MTDQEKIVKLVAACQKANRYLADMAVNGGPRKGIDGINDWSETQQALYDALRFEGQPPKEYKSRTAREAQAANFGNQFYWDYLEQHAGELFLRGVSDAYTRSLSEALAGNNGE